jgi:hypothetical protein
VLIPVVQKAARELSVNRHQSAKEQQQRADELERELNRLRSEQEQQKSQATFVRLTCACKTPFSSTVHFNVVEDKHGDGSIGGRERSPERPTARR